MSDRTIYEHIGEQIKINRKQCRYTQTELAQMVGLKRSSLTNIENGRQRVQVHTLYAITAALGIQITALMPNVIITKEPLPFE